MSFKITTYLGYNTPFSITPVQNGPKKESSDLYMGVIRQFMRYLNSNTRIGFDMPQPLPALSL
jgi:hypothetical protein